VIQGVNKTRAFPSHATINTSSTNTTRQDELTVSVHTPKPFLEGLRDGLNRRYPLTEAEARIHDRIFRIALCFIPGAELPELLLAREAFQRASVAGDEEAKEVARIDAVWVCLNLGLSGLLPGIAEGIEEVYELSGGKMAAGSRTVGVLRASLSEGGDANDPFVRIARGCLALPGTRRALDALLRVRFSRLTERSS
jgi:hypothetical protein